jgi:hypothetical protein
MLPVRFDDWFDDWFDTGCEKLVNVLRLANELLPVSCSSSFAVPMPVLFPVLFPVVLLTAITVVPLERTMPIAIPIKNILASTSLSSIHTIKVL